MEKPIEQLLELSKNPYFTLSDEEQARLDAFLSKKSAQQSRQKTSGNDSERNIPATVINRNIVRKETGEIPTYENVATPDSTEVPSDES